MKRLTIEEARRITELYLITSCSLAHLARHFDVSPTTIAKIVDGKWKPFVPKPKPYRYVRMRYTPDEKE